YSYKGDTVFFVPAPCCDHTSELYDSTGKLLCAPDGGITGRGDGKCKDFMTSRKDELSVWQDARTPGGKTPPTKGGGAPKSTATQSPPIIPPRPQATQ
ncbi:MAG TPA: hypothetical protein VFS00_05615, partial [Polyangiaceae bacterium]|nr:hypothetical protein [Polyangiaceae bacterium]